MKTKFLSLLFSTTVIISACGGKSNNAPANISALNPLNDTGITNCLNTDGSFSSCPSADYPNQDAEFGNDANTNTIKLGTGAAGFDFTKIDANGAPLPLQQETWDDNGSEPANTQWSCIQDNVTGLLWEVKNDNPDSPHYQWHTYSWYNPVPAENGGVAGAGNLGMCGINRCDTLAYVFYANQNQLCGKTDWRLPAPTELLSIVNQTQVNPAVDEHYFPATQPNAYWTHQNVLSNPDEAWYIYFTAGGNGHINKNGLGYIRLVSGDDTPNPARFEVNPATPSIVIDHDTGLRWMRCSIGQQWDTASNTCVIDASQASSLTWQAALQLSDTLSHEGISNWRLPNKKELASIVDYTQASPAIDPTLFPGTPSENFWTASALPYADSPTAWFIDFDDGGFNSGPIENVFTARLVQGQ